MCTFRDISLTRDTTGNLALSLEPAEPLLGGEAQILLDAEYAVSDGSASASSTAARATPPPVAAPAKPSPRFQYQYEALGVPRSSILGADMEHKQAQALTVSMHANDKLSPSHRPLSSDGVAPTTVAVSPLTAQQARLKRWMFTRGRQRSDSLIASETLLSKPERTPNSRYVRLM